MGFVELELEVSVGDKRIFLRKLVDYPARGYGGEEELAKETEGASSWSGRRRNMPVYQHRG